MPVHRPATLSAAFCLCVVAPATSLAQPPIYLRMSPELGLVHIEHTKVLTDASGSASNTATSIGPDFVINLSIGFFGEHSDNWVSGGEVQFAISSRQSIGGSMTATGTGPAAVGPGTWDYNNRVGAGANLFFGRDLTRRKMRSYLLAGFKRWTTETVSRALHPDFGEFSDRNVGVRWPWTVGIGVTLLRERRLDFRLRYFQSVTNWSRTRPLDPETEEPDPEMLTWDFKFGGRGVALQFGFGTG